MKYATIIMNEENGEVLANLDILMLGLQRGQGILINPGDRCKTLEVIYSTIEIYIHEVRMVVMARLLS